LFAEKGFEESHIGIIAARADVVIGTVYNYFESKHGLILALTARYARETVGLREDLVADPPDDPLAALDAYNAVVFDNSLRHLSKLLWRRVLQAGMASGENLSAMMPMIDELLLGQVTRMLQTLQRRGRLRDGVNVRDLAAIALAIQTIHWQRFVASDAIPLAQVKRVRCRSGTGPSDDIAVRNRARSSRECSHSCRLLLLWMARPLIPLGSPRSQRRGG
jgi:AcrR family transcriptional regulator